MVARGDYAANAGVRSDSSTTGCKSVAYPSSYPTGSTPWDTNTYSGIVFQRSTISDGQIHDGLSHTYLFGEKFLDPTHYDDGGSESDADVLYSGFGNDNYRITNPNTINSSKIAMANDTREDSAAANAHVCMFGGPHPGVVNFTFCDGSTKSVPVTIDPDVHQHLGERSDGQIIDDSSFN